MSNQIQKYGTRKLFGNDVQMESDQKGLFEAILFRGTLTAGAGKDISKLCLKLRVVGKRRWRNRPFWSPNCANPRPNRL